jgi:hypothetical protein
VEPYTVCCIEGLKVSCAMHLFGSSRFGNGIWNDYFAARHNNRLLGDFRKSIKISSILQRMTRKLSSEEHWKRKSILHGKDSEQAATVTSSLLELSTIHTRRERVQCRLFECGNNVYLGMELPREFDQWKRGLEIKSNFLDRLWYEATFELLSESQSIRKRERKRIPRFILEDSSFLVRVGEIGLFESFRFSDQTFRLVAQKESSSEGRVSVFEVNDGRKNDRLTINPHVLVIQQNETKCCTLAQLRENDLFCVVDHFEVIKQETQSALVRTSTGHVCRIPRRTRVHRSSDLSRAPNGYSESKVSLASFEVAHYVSHRTLHLGAKTKSNREGFVKVLIGDAQASVSFCFCCLPCQTLTP